MLVKINDTDITQYILSETYDMNQSDVYVEWTDANYIDHRNIVRTRVEGKFEVKFLLQRNYDSFVELINSNKTVGGYIPLTVYVNNQVTTKKIDAFCEFKPIILKDYGDGKIYKSFKIEVKER